MDRKKEKVIKCICSDVHRPVDVPIPGYKGLSNAINPKDPAVAPKIGFPIAPLSFAHFAATHPPSVQYKETGTSPFIVPFEDAHSGLLNLDRAALPNLTQWSATVPGKCDHYHFRFFVNYSLS